MTTIRLARHDSFNRTRYYPEPEMGGEPRGISFEVLDDKEISWRLYLIALRITSSNPPTSKGSFNTRTTPG